MFKLKRFMLMAICIMSVSLAGLVQAAVPFDVGWQADSYIQIDNMTKANALEAQNLGGDSDPFWIESTIAGGKKNKPNPKPKPNPPYVVAQAIAVVGSCFNHRHQHEGKRLWWSDH